MYTDNSEYLCHYGIIGMKWGQRRVARAEAGLKRLDSGGHLSISITKNRQDQYDARDRRILTNRIQSTKKSLQENDEKRAQKKLVKSQKKYDANFNANWYKAYNKAADKFNNEGFLQNLNDKYKNYNWGSLKFENGKAISGDKKLIESYNKYVDEYEKTFQNVLNSSYKDMFGDRPT